MTRILHTADWQIGRLYGSFDPDDAVPLAEARGGRLGHSRRSAGARAAGVEHASFVYSLAHLRFEAFEAGQTLGGLSSRASAGL